MTLLTPDTELADTPMTQHQPEAPRDRGNADTADETAPSPQETETRGPGRPRDDELDERILSVALRFIDAGEPVTVARLVAESGVSRAAIYRRWPTMRDLVLTALDVGRSVPPELPEHTELREELLHYFFGGGHESVSPDYPDRRFRERIRLMMADPELQRSYWSGHVARRREPLRRALERGIADGVLRPDLDVWAAIDLLAGVAYYQIIVRGERLDDPEASARVESAVDIVWSGMTVDFPTPRREGTGGDRTEERG